MEEKKIFKLMGFSMQNSNNVPKITEKKSKRYIEFGEKNLYPDFLDELIYNSAKHSAICKTKADFIAGKGFKKKENASKAYVDFIANAYGEESLADIAYKAAYDLVVHNYFVLNINWSNDKTRIASIEYVPASYMRKATCGQGEIESVEYFFLSSCWAKERQTEFIPELYQGLSSIYNGRLDASGNTVGSPNQICVSSTYMPGVKYYSLPDYVAGLDYIQLDTEIIQYHLSSIQNGFSPSYIINFNTIPTDEEMEQAKRDLEKQYAGASNAGKIIMTFSDGKDRAPEIHKIETLDSDTRFADLLSLVNDGIFTIHRTPDAILGAKTPGQLGGVQELENTYTLWKEGTIAPKQREIEKLLNKLARYNGVVEPIELEDYNIFANIKPTN